MTSHRRIDLLVIGDVDVDLYIGASRTPAPGEKVLGRLLGLYGGGMAGNVACAASKLGLRTALASRVGDDDLARVAVRYLTDCGVDLTHLESDPQINTYVGVITLDEMGEKSLVVADGGALFPSAEGAKALKPAEARAVHIIPFDLPAAAAIARRAAESDAHVSIDLEATMLPSELLQSADLQSLLKSADVVFCNHHTTLALANSYLGGITELHRAGARVIVMTAGAEGALVSDDAGIEAVPAAPAEVVDTSGAGDCFAAGFLAAILSSAEPLAAAREAVKVAARSIATVGGSQGITRIAR